MKSRIKPRMVFFFFLLVFFERDVHSAGNWINYTTLDIFSKASRDSGLIWCVQVWLIDNTHESVQLLESLRGKQMEEKILINLFTMIYFHHLHHYYYSCTRSVAICIHDPFSGMQIALHHQSCR